MGVSPRRWTTCGDTLPARWEKTPAPASWSNPPRHGAECTAAPRGFVAVVLVLDTVHVAAVFRASLGWRNETHPACPVFGRGAVFAFLMLALAGQLRDAFREIDSDNNGSICVDELKMVVKKEGEARAGQV